MLNSLYKRIARNLIKSRILIVDPGDEVDVDNFCDWLGDQGVGSPDHFPEPTTSSTIHYAIHAFTHLLGLWEVSFSSFR